MINLDQKYQGAWNEINSRLQSRQTVFVTYLSVALILNGLIPTNNATLALIISCIMPFTALAFSLWVYHNDLTIGLLSKFCEECERFENADFGKQPSWHSKSQSWMTIALRYRNAGNIGFILAVLISMVPAIFSLFNIATNKMWVGALLLSATIGLFTSLYFLCTINKKRKEILSAWSLKSIDNQLFFMKNNETPTS